MRLGFKKGILIYLGALFLMSHIISNNVGAVSNTVYLKYGLYAYGIPQNSGGQGGSSQNLTSGQQYNLQNNLYVLNGNNIWYSMAFKLTPDNAQIDLSMYTDYTFSFSYCSNINYFMPSSNDLFRMTNYYEFDADVKRIITDFRDSTNSNLNLYDVQRCRNVIMYGKVKEDLTYNAFQLGTTNNDSFTRIFGIMPYEYNAPFNNLIISSPTVVLYDNPNEAAEALEKEKQETQAAADESKTEAEDNSESQQTDSIINVFGSFITALTSLQPTNCNVTLQWPSSLGGNMTVNVCQNKDKAGSIISVFGSITLLVFYIPLALKLLSMIYNEIRSFTNG